MQWTKPLPQQAFGRERGPLAVAAQLRRHFDLEDILTLGLLLAAICSVSAALESGGWSRSMPALTLVSVIAAVTALVLARFRIPALVAWTGGLLAGAAVVFWQALIMVGPGSLWYRLDQLWFRFDFWLHQALNDQVSNDPLPFNVLVLALTWLGVFLFGWSVFRWHNAWIGLVPGGIALFLDIAFVGDNLTGATLLFYLFGFLLVMRTHLMYRMERWRTEGTEYPPLISLTYLNFSTWALIALILAAWLAPVGPFSTPGFVQAGVNRVLTLGTEFVRLAGPLEVKKVVPVHNYGGVLPLQGSVKLGSRELLTVKVEDPNLQGPFVLRGAVYDTYGSGGWEAGDRVEIELAPDIRERVEEMIREREVEGTIVPMTIEVEAKSVVGGVVFSAGQPLLTSEEVSALVPEGSIREAVLCCLPSNGRGLSDQEIYERLPEGVIGIDVVRDDARAVRFVRVIDEELVVPDALLRPRERIEKGGVYWVESFVGSLSDDELRKAGRDYPSWVYRYTQLPDTLPDRVRVRAAEIGLGPEGRYDNAFDIAKRIEAYLRGFPVDYDVPDTPPGRDTVDYFLFDLQRGYFDYHASAMVVMLRALGIPARLGVGFVIDEDDYDRERGGYVVRDRNSYAWAEAYFPGYGWVVFNPSNDRPEVLRPQQRTEPLPDADEPVDIRDLPIPVGADPIFGDPLPVRGNPPSSQAPGPGGGGGFSLWYTAAAAGFAALLFAIFCIGWQRSVAGLPYAQQHWEKLVRLASWAGCPPQPGQTPTEFANSLQRRFRGLTGVPIIAAAYNRSRFARQEPGAEEKERIREVWPGLRAGLIGEVAGRLLRRRRRGAG